MEAAALAEKMGCAGREPALQVCTMDVPERSSRVKTWVWRDRGLLLGGSVGREGCVDNRWDLDWGGRWGLHLRHAL